jgi:hypothetical protein
VSQSGDFPLLTGHFCPNLPFAMSALQKLVEVKAVVPWFDIRLTSGRLAR